MDNPIIRPFGEFTILLTWKSEISSAINQQVRSADALIQQNFKDEIIETVITYAELAIYLKPEMDQKGVIENLRKIDWNTNIFSNVDCFLWQIPVCYSTDFGLDLGEMAEAKGMSTDDIIQSHTSVQFPVYFIGFLPGFLYLGDLPDALHHPRKDTPRIRVPKGAIAIGGKQTGIYPMESPGGWNIIGQTPIQLFDIQNDPPIEIKSGDKVQFVSISEIEFQHIRTQVEYANYKPSKTPLT